VLAGTLTVSEQIINQDMEISVTTEDKLVTVTVNGEYELYFWYVENVKQSCTENAFVFDATSVKAGVYEIKAVAQKGILFYSAQVSIKVQ
jgi:hypothetical protein